MCPVSTIVSLQTNSAPKNITMFLKILYSEQRVLVTSCVQDCRDYRDNCSEYRASFLSHTSSSLSLIFTFIIKTDHQLRQHLQNSTVNSMTESQIMNRPNRPLICHRGKSLPRLEDLNRFDRSFARETNQN